MDTTLASSQAIRATAVAFLLVCAACTALLDRNPDQCTQDSDCAHFGGHPFCQAGACVQSGLGPTGCFYGAPMQTSDFMNQCSNAQCLGVDDCTLGVCGDAGVPLIPPPDAGSTPATDAGASEGGAPALPNCVDPDNGRPQVIYMTGSSNFPPLLAKLAPLIATTGYIPVFQVSSSCGGVKAAFSPSPADQTMVDPDPGPSAKYAAYFQADGTSASCLVGPSGAPIDVGESDIFSTTCSGYGPPGGSIGEYLGPIQSMVFVVPGESQATSISAEAARVVFGTGGQNVTPWNDPNLYFVRNANTGTQQMIGHAIGVPATQFWGIDRGTAANVDALMRVISDATLANQAIGIVSSDYYDADRANLKALAFRSTSQDCAYLPDSTEFKKDKQNVRDGHYPVWGPIHFFTTVSNGIPVSPAAQAFVSVVSVPNLAKGLVDAFIASSLVPSCAMNVQRSEELGALASFSAPFQCGCYFEASLNGSPSSECAACNTANDCTSPARPACNLGFCEVQ